MGNKPAATKFTQGSFTERLAAHSGVAYYLYPRHAECKVWVPFMIDQLLVGRAALEDAHVREALLERADPIASIFGEDGPPGNDKPQLGKFYELETSSPARELKKGETLKHTHRTIHFQGDEKSLDAIARSTLGVNLSQIQAALKGA